jgi:hypothetical protein
VTVTGSELSSATVTFCGVACGGWSAVATVIAIVAVLQRGAAQPAVEPLSHAV